MAERGRENREERKKGMGAKRERGREGGWVRGRERVRADKIT